MFFILYLLTPRATSDAPLQSLFRPVKGRPSQPTRTAYRHSPVLVSTTHHRRRDTGAKFSYGNSIISSSRDQIDLPTVPPIALCVETDTRVTWSAHPNGRLLPTTKIPMGHTLFISPNSIMRLC